jgi:CHAT domain-containing protein
MPTKRVVLAEYFTIDDQTLLFIVRADFNEPQVVEIRVPLAEVRQFVTTHFSVGTRGSRVHGLDLDAWQALLGAFVEPILPWTDEEDIVWLVPHDVLHYLPLHALKVEGDYFIKRNPICYTPSASVMKYCQAKRKGRRERALILADSRPDRPLLHAREQALAIEHLFAPHAEVHLGGVATKALVKQRLTEAKDDFDVLHFACHGFFSSHQALRSGIMLAPGNHSVPTQEDTEGLRITEVDGGEWNLTAEEIFSLELRADLVTLSACESGVNERRPGDELIGLTRAFIYAGTPSVLVSLWTVDELSTSILMREFYQQLLRSGATKVEALQRAQLHLQELPIAGALRYIESLRNRHDLDAPTRVYLHLTKAKMLLKARDYPAAQAAFQEVLRLEELDHQSRRQARAGIENARAGAQAGVAMNYDGCLYDDPYHWAPFILVGDWK